MSQVTTQAPADLVVRFATLPGQIRRVILDPGATLADVLDAADASSEGMQVRINGQTVTDLGTPVSDNDTVLLSRQIKGN